MAAAWSSSGPGKDAPQLRTFCFGKWVREASHCRRSCQSASAAADGAALQKLLEQLLVELAVIKGLRIPLLHQPVQVIILLLLLGLLIAGFLPSLRLYDTGISILHSIEKAGPLPHRHGMHWAFDGKVHQRLAFQNWHLCGQAWQGLPRRPS